MKLKNITPEMVSRNEATGKWSIQGLESEPTYEKILYNLEHQIPFSLSRYGDGEWNAIFNKAGNNCDGHEYFTDMGAELKQAVLSEPEYLMGIQPLTMSHYRDKVVDFAGDLDIDWVNSDVLHDANIKEQLKRFFNVLRDQPVIMIAPTRLQDVPFHYGRFVEVPLKNCWLEKSRIEKELFEVLPQVGYAVLLFCASMATNVMIHDLYKYYGTQVTMIDAGSIFDPYCGFNTRRYHEKMKI
jgi:hypothetical protein